MSLSQDLLKFLPRPLTLIGDQSMVLEIPFMSLIHPIHPSNPHNLPLLLEHPHFMNKVIVVKEDP